MELLRKGMADVRSDRPRSGRRSEVNVVDGPWFLTRSRIRYPEESMGLVQKKLRSAGEDVKSTSKFVVVVSSVYGQTNLGKHNMNHVLACTTCK